MNNRDNLYKTCMYDLIIEVAERAAICPIVLFSGFIPESYNVKCEIPSDCKDCVQNWLNEEVKTIGGKNNER